MDFPLLSIFLTMLFFFLWIVWLILLFKIIGDIFRSHDLGGGAKAGWLLLVLILPFVGVFAYLIARGDSMAERHERPTARL
ncbi:PLDc N-terminal domain-containing protein [Streptomyces sp. B15]|nr:PLDc N-terminal domain-containing protein [Streptomyces sp. RK75]MBQ1124630.1 PLDc N-terminal domain-containing protein [Streptomyces sp. B15]